MTSRFTFLPLLSAVLLVACSGSPLSKTAAKPVNTATGSSAGTTAAAVGAIAISGVVRAPAGLISNDGGSIVAQGGGNVVAQGGGNIVAQGGGNALGKVATSLHVLTLGESPLANTAVYAADRSGKPLPGIHAVRTDANGAFTLHVPSGGAYQIVALAKAPKGDAKLTTLAHGSGADNSADVSAATTVVTAGLVDDTAGALGDFDPASFKQAVDAMTAHLTVQTLPDLTDRAAMRGFMLDLESKVSELGVVMNRMNAQLARFDTKIDGVATAVANVDAKIDGLQHALDKLTASAAPTPVAISSSTAASPTTSPTLDGSPTPVPVASPAATGFDFDPIALRAEFASATADHWGAAKYMFKDPQGGDWIDSDGGFTRVRSAGKELMPVNCDSIDLRGAAMDAHGTIWMADAHRGKLLRLMNGQLSAAKWQPAGGTPTGVAVGSDGAIWFTAVNLVARIDLASGAPALFPTTQADAGPVAAAGDGAAWVVLGDKIVLMDAQMHAGVSVPLGQVSRMVADGHGGAWCRTGAGLSKLDGASQTLVSVQNSGSFSALAVDTDGSCWAVDANAGSVQKIAPTGLRSGDPISFIGSFQGIAAETTGHFTLIAGNQVNAF